MLPSFPCPVCSASAAFGAESCSVCGFDLRPLLDSSPQAQAAWQERVRAARVLRTRDRELSPSKPQWKEVVALELIPNGESLVRSIHSPSDFKEPKLEFVLNERDPFETHQEFIDRRKKEFAQWDAELGKEAYCAGQVSLINPKPPSGPLQIWQTKPKRWPLWAERVRIPLLDFATILDAKYAASLTGQESPAFELWVKLHAETESQFSVTSAFLRVENREIPLFRGEVKEKYQKLIASKRWKIGEARLSKADYDIETGKFPLKWERTEDWLASTGADLPSLHLQLDRDRSRILYEKGQSWALYADLFVWGEHLQIARAFIHPQILEFSFSPQIYISSHPSPPGDWSINFLFRSIELSSTRPSHEVEGFVWHPPGITYYTPSKEFEASGLVLCVKRENWNDVTKGIPINSDPKSAVDEKLQSFIVLTKGFWIKKKPLEVYKEEQQASYRGQIIFFWFLFALPLIIAMFYPFSVLVIFGCVLGVIFGWLYFDDQVPIYPAIFFFASSFGVWYGDFFWHNNLFGKVLAVLIHVFPLIPLLEFTTEKWHIPSIRKVPGGELDAMMHCNELSLCEGLIPAYQGGDRNHFRAEIVAGSSGYRLLTKEWAALFRKELSPKAEFYLFRPDV